MCAVQRIQYLAPELRIEMNTPCEAISVAKVLRQQLARNFFELQHDESGLSGARREQTRPETVIQDHRLARIILEFEHIRYEVLFQDTVQGPGQ